MVENFNDVLGHGRCRVPRCRLVGVANTSVVSYQRRVLVAFGMTKISCLTLPCIFHATKAHDPLHGVSCQVFSALAVNVMETKRHTDGDEETEDGEKKGYRLKCGSARIGCVFDNLRHDTS